MKIGTVPHSSLFLQHLVQIYAGPKEGAQLMSKLRERMNEENLSLSCLPFLYITCKPFLEKKSFLPLCLTAATNKLLCTCRCSISVGSLFRWFIIPLHPRDKHMKERVGLSIPILSIICHKFYNILIISTITQYLSA